MEENLHNFKSGDYVRLLNLDVTVRLGNDDDVEVARTTRESDIRHARPDEIKAHKEESDD